MDLIIPRHIPVTDIDCFLNPAKIKLIKWNSPDKCILDPSGNMVPDWFLYPSLECNQVFLYQLAEERKNRGLYSPLEFLNSLYFIFEIILANLGKDHIKELQVFRWTYEIEPLRARRRFLMESIYYLLNELNRSTPLLGTVNSNSDKIVLDPVSEDILYGITVPLGLHLGNHYRPGSSSINDGKPSLTQLALIHQFNNSPITSIDQGDDIIFKYGLVNDDGYPQSGATLYKYYKQFLSKATQTSVPRRHNHCEQRLADLKSIRESGLLSAKGEEIFKERLLLIRSNAHSHEYSELIISEINKLLENSHQ